MKRPICSSCNQKHCAINYKRKGKTYYRTKCAACLRKSKKIKPPKPNWQQAGYKKKMACDLCRFKARWPQQIMVYYVDGDLTNTALSNLKSVCLNCSVSIEKEELPWSKDTNLGLSADN